MVRWMHCSRSMIGMFCRAGSAGRGRRRRVAEPPDVVVPGVRFAFYGRTSTAEFQDPVTSRAWQREMAATLVAGHGTITAEFFDVGCSRRVAWERRPQAAALLEQAQGADRRSTRWWWGSSSGRSPIASSSRSPGFCGGVGSLVWLPEAGGPVDLDDPDASGVDAGAGGAVAAGGGAVTSSDDGGDDGADGRAGPVPRRSPAVRVPAGGRGSASEPGARRVGTALHRLDPDPVTAPHVRWMFAERLAGRSVAGIARELNERGVPCPSAADPERNRHRSGQGWNLRSVAVILANPRYTGRQVWSRQRSVPGAGRSTVAGEWAVSRTMSHPALVSEADFVAVQQCRAARRCEDGATRDYVLAGLVQCRVVRAADGLALGQRSRRVPLPSRSPQRPGPTRGRGRATSTSARTCSWPGSPGNSRPIGTDPAATSSRAPSKRSSPGCGPSRR